MQENALKVPSNVEAEVALIGCIFIDENLIVQAVDVLEPDDFYDQKNRLIYRAMTKLTNSGKGVDVASVIAMLQSENILEQCGGIAYITSIAEHSYSSLNFETYCQLISEASIKRATINKLQKLASSGYDTSIGTFDYVEQVEKEVFELSKRRNVDSFKSIKDVSKNVMVNTESNFNRKSEIIGLDTGFRDLNRYTQGFQPGQLIILAARPSMGKSAFAMNVAVNVATHNKGGNAKVAIFSLEMSAEQIVERMIAGETYISLSNIKNGRFVNDSDWQKFTSACSKLSNLNLYFDDSSNCSMAVMRAKCRKLASESGLDFVVVDYLQLVGGDGDQTRISQQERISKISRSLKLMARELNVPVLALSQLSRAVETREDKHPMMSDLRDSGSIEQDADIVMFLYREEYYKKDSTKKKEAELIISKNRSGATCEGLAMSFLGEYAKFQEKQD